MTDDEDPESKHGAWTPEEDRLLAYFQKTYGNRWSLVAQHISGRTGQQCAQRWRHKVNPHIRKEKWTVEEDRSLAALVALHGNKWADIAKHIPGRTDQQCMGRWRRHLDPNIRKCSWLAKEDEVLKTKFNAIGSQWSNISKFLEGRTAQQCRARWFQICPDEPEAAQRQVPAVAPTHKRERHHDGVSIKASARSLLAQMDEGAASAKGKACKKSRAVIQRGVSLASQAEALSQDTDDSLVGSSEDEAGPSRGQGRASSRAPPAGASQRAGTRRTAAACASSAAAAAEEAEAAPTRRGLRGSLRAQVTPQTEAVFSRRTPAHRQPPCTGLAALDPCDFKWSNKAKRTILDTRSAPTPSSTRSGGRERTPSPCKKTRGHETFRTPDSGAKNQERLSEEPGAEDIEAADILTELSGSFTLTARRTSPTSVRQPARSLLTTKDSPAGKADYSWGDAQPAFLTTPSKSRPSADGCLHPGSPLNTPRTLENDTARQYGSLGTHSNEGSAWAPHNALLMTPSSQKILNGLSYEPMDKSVDLSVGFTPFSDELPLAGGIPSLGVPPASAKRHAGSDDASPRSPERKPAARRLQFSERGTADDVDAVREPARPAPRSSAAGAMLPPPPHTSAFESPSKKRRVAPAACPTPARAPPTSAVGATAFQAIATPRSGAAERPAASSASAAARPAAAEQQLRCSGGGAGHAYDARAPPRKSTAAAIDYHLLAVTPLVLKTDRCDDTGVATVRVDVAVRERGGAGGSSLAHSLDSALESPTAATTLSHKENRFGNERSVGEQPLFDSGTSSMDVLELRRAGSQVDDAEHTQPVVAVASSHQIKHQLENLIDDVFAGF